MRGLLCFFLVACSNAPASTYVGKPCGYQQPACGGGTTCLAKGDIASLDGGAPICMSAMTQACSIQCATDVDCTNALGAGFKCETRCSPFAFSYCAAQ